jgi:hypothetical protein
MEIDVVLFAHVDVLFRILRFLLFPNLGLVVFQNLIWIPNLLPVRLNLGLCSYERLLLIRIGQLRWIASLTSLPMTMPFSALTVLWKLCSLANVSALVVMFSLFLAFGLPTQIPEGVPKCFAV